MCSFALQAAFYEVAQLRELDALSLKWVRLDPESSELAIHFGKLILDVLFHLREGRYGKWSGHGLAHYSGPTDG